MSTSNMDPFDEFEFKPLTDGLGFHKKTKSLKDGLNQSGVVKEELVDLPASLPRDMVEEGSRTSGSKKPTFEDVLSALEKTPLQRATTPTVDLNFTEPLPTAAMPPRKARGGVVESPTVQSPFPKADAYVAKAKEGTRRGAADSPKRHLLKPAMISVPSAILDLIIVTAFALVFVMALLMVTKVDLNVVLKNLNQDPLTQLSLGVLFIAVMQMYVVISRSFFGCTLGEWTFDLQVGEDEQQKRESYPLRVALRSLLITMTGVVILPVISTILRRDIAGSLSGVNLWAKS